MKELIRFVIFLNKHCIIVNYVFNTPTKCTYNKIHILIITFLLLVSALIAPSSGRIFLYAQNIVTLYDYIGLRLFTVI